VDAVRDRSGWWLVYLDGDSVGYVAGSLLRAEPPDSLGGLVARAEPRLGT
jgi:hypothetical protein